MKEKTVHYIAIFYIIFEVIATIALIITHAIFDVNGYFTLWFSLTAYLFIPLGSIVVALIYKKWYNRAKNHLRIYASRSKLLLEKSNLSSTLFFSIEVNLNPKDEEYEEYVDKGKTISKEAGRVILCIVFSAIYVAFDLMGFHINNDGIMAMTVIAALIAVCYLFYFLIFVLDTLTIKYEKILFNKAKIQAIKDFDEEDETIQITDYKIYEYEMYIQVPAKTKTLYALITRNKLYIIPLSNDLIQERDDLLDIDYKAHKKFLKKMQVKTYNIRKKDIIDVLKIVREGIYIF